MKRRKRRIERRLDRNDNRGCDEPIMTASNIHYEIGARSRATVHGGIGAVQLLARRPELDAAIDRRLRLLKVHLPYHESDHVLNIAYNLLAGGTYFDRSISLCRTAGFRTIRLRGDTDFTQLAQLKSGARSLTAPVDNLLSNWAYMVMGSLAWSLKAWAALMLPEEGRWQERHREEKWKLVRMEFTTFQHAMMRISAQIVSTGRKIVYRLLGWNPWQHVFFRLIEQLRRPLRC